jgi:nucleoid DNA-binding protein
MKAHTMNKAQLALAIADETGLNKTTTYAMLTALTQQLDAEGIAGRAVVLEHFGTFLPRKKMGKRTGRVLGGGILTYDNWKLIVDPEQCDELTFITLMAERGETKPALAAIVLQSYKTLVLRTLREGGIVQNQGHGVYKVEKRKARVYHDAEGRVSSKQPAKKAVVYRAGKYGPHQKFIALPGFL